MTWQPDPRSCRRPRVELRSDVATAWAHCYGCGYESDRFRGETALEAAELQARNHERQAAARSRQASQQGGGGVSE